MTIRGWLHYQLAAPKSVQEWVYKETVSSMVWRWWDGYVPTDRKMRLWASALCRQTRLLDTLHLLALQVGESLEAGIIPSEGDRDANSPVVVVSGKTTWAVAKQVVKKAEQEEQTDWITALAQELFHQGSCSSPLDPAWINWNDGCVGKLALAAYNHRILPSGQLDNTRLSILADALEEAGCSSVDLLDHMRGAGPHARGCWAVDALLGMGQGNTLAAGEAGKLHDLGDFAGRLCW